MAEVRIRKATPGDCDAMLEWRNHPETHRHFFNPNPIAPEAHRAWFEATLSNPDRHLLIAEEESGRPVGVVRFDVSGEEAEIDIYLAPESRGKKLGVGLLHAGMEWLKSNTGVRRVRAEVIPANASSLRLFAQGGFATRAYSMVAELSQ
jgi:RimJ/RimL family protein N-acetyltransferase